MSARLQNALTEAERIAARAEELEAVKSRQAAEISRARSLLAAAYPEKAGADLCAHLAALIEERDALLRLLRRPAPKP